MLFRLRLGLSSYYIGFKFFISYIFLYVLNKSFEVIQYSLTLKNAGPRLMSTNKAVWSSMSVSAFICSVTNIRVQEPYQFSHIYDTLRLISGSAANWLVNIVLYFFTASSASFSKNKTSITPKYSKYFFC